MDIIEFKNVDFEYPNGVSAVENVSFKIKKGENIAIVGQNGAGKTTTVKMINGLLKPTKGNIIVKGKNTKDFSTAQLSRDAGYVFQNPDDQIFHNTVREEIEFGPKVLGFSEEKAKKVVDSAIKLSGLKNELDENPYNLSQAIRKLVTIASVIAMDTDIIILDEPTAGQDYFGLTRLENILTKLKENGKTIITITHDMEYVANNFQTVFVMANRTLLKIGNPQYIFNNDELLDISMLKRPYISLISHKLGIDTNPIKTEELIDYITESIFFQQKKCL